MSGRTSVLTVILFLGVITFFLKNVEVSPPINASDVEAKLDNLESALDTVAFISQIQESWNFADKDVYRDFRDYNALQSNDFGTDTLFEAQVVRILEHPDLDEAINKLRNYKKLEALLFANCIFTDQQLVTLVEMLDHKPHFKKLIIHSSNIDKLPNNLAELQGLETLVISFSKLKEVNEAILELTQLKHLSFKSNLPLRKLPEDLGKLKNLELLNISDCSIDSIPTSIGNCTNLKVLTANAGKLEYVPNSIGNCQALISLNLGYNHIANLPDSVGKLRNLGMLIVGHNPYDSIPMSYRNLGKLFHFQ